MYDCLNSKAHHALGLQFQRQFQRHINKTLWLPKLYLHSLNRGSISIEYMCEWEQLQCRFCRNFTGLHCHISSNAQFATNINKLTRKQHLGNSPLYLSITFNTDMIIACWASSIMDCQINCKSATKTTMVLITLNSFQNESYASAKTKKTNA